MSKERRQYKRFDVSLEIAFKASQESDTYFFGSVKNFSRKGLCFESQTLGPALHSPVELKVKLPGEDTFISASGNVSWKEQFKDKCWVGVEIEEMNTEAKGQILDYAFDQWVEKNRELNRTV